MENGTTKRIDPITPFVKEKIFANEPRPKQRDAIDIALNTPDIAIIQGPPGTGKTTVITAIIERLNETADKRKDNRGQVLITSFQHDAVRNVIERLSVNSLPTLKFGRKGEDDNSREEAMQKWCIDYAERLKEKNPSIRQTEDQRKLERMFNSYLSFPNDTKAREFLEFVKTINTDNVLNTEIDLILSDLNLEDDTSFSSSLLEKTRRLRTTKEGFCDDGAEAAGDLLYDLEDKVGKANKYILDVLEEAEACDSEADVSQELLNSVEKVKNTLLEKFIPGPSYKIERPRAEISEVYAEISQAIRRPQNAEDEILYNLLNELENNLSEAAKTIAEYNFVYAATAQQSEGKEIKDAKNTAREEHPTYDTVIIDEAARVNPGDLMIPMAQAKRRIILVGDHRQLPHIYDEEIFESIEDSNNDVGKNAVKISMFQYLKEKAEELYKKDGIARTITLDAQYRMHPELGNFINSNFYAPYGEGFESPLPGEAFEQKLEKTPYLWVNMHELSGKEQREGTSRFRLCEAEFIVNKLKEYISSEEGKNLSYGVITFYSAQVGKIRGLLKSSGIDSRVRVGSVDAFQGMEFDVIFLSVVRSHSKAPDYDENLLNADFSEADETDKAYEEWKAYKEKIGMRNYGFLTSENRLCVALSRQKKLLIVVGNSSIFASDKWRNVASVCVPALKNFYELCCEKRAVINA